MTQPLPAIAVGLDLVSVSSVAEAIEAHGERYLKRLFTEQELASCQGDPLTRAASLAARVAAKEATLKVLRPRDRPGEAEDAVPAWTDIEVVRHTDGWCSLRLTGVAAMIKESLSLVDIALSMSHEDGMAAAVVVGLRWPSR